ncbi:MAG: DUF916 domain-containing protein, partial [Micrococcales bacterium]|nr:DUF916 domain-containing protein [Micrococcales bacterium]
MKKRLFGRLTPYLLATGTLSLALTGLGLALPQRALAEDTVGIAIAPASQNGLDDRSRFSYQIEPGQKISDHVRVGNPGSTPITLTVLAADAYNTEDGGYALIDTKDESTNAGSWVTFEDNQTKVVVELEPDEAKIIAFELNVPADATPGDHPGGIVASASAVGEGEITVERRGGPPIVVGGGGG